MTIETIEGYFRQMGWSNLFIDRSKDIILAPVGGINGSYMVTVRLSEDGECIHLCIPNYLTARGKHVPKLLAVLMAEHYRIKLGRFGYDPRDGEIDCEIIIPLEDGELTF
ncbi:MAG TPA: hypothetical protein EYP10_05365, partial [Armatimonadetes bacterium]|nr:hypothetical protein [Armatimonadota bacterium]